MRIAPAVVFVIALLSCTTFSAAQSPTPLTSGFNQERTLSPGDRHVYTITLAEGAAVLGKADQHGVDLVIDIFGPDGKLIRTVDSPNGTEGPEPIDLTAFTSGQYKLVIHTLDPSARPGKYVMQIDRVVPPQENASRLAAINYPAALQALWKDYINDPKALDRFVNGRKGQGPIIEEIKGDFRNLNVTYLYYGGEHTDHVEVFGGTHAGVGGTQMQRFLRTPLFFGTETVPKDARYRYGFIVTETRFAGSGGSIQVLEEQQLPDRLNPLSFNGLSALVLPSAPAQPYIVESASVPHGKLEPKTLKSTYLKEDRPLSIYTPPGYDAATSADLLIIFDGETYDGGPASSVPGPTILNNLIAAKKIGPTVAIFVKNIGKRNRDLGGYAPFAGFVALELVPWVRQNYSINDGPGHVVAAGSSRGGLAASHLGFTHSDVVGNVLSQSGAYWVRNENSDAWPWPLSEDTGDLTLAFRDSPRVPIKFYLEVGRFDSLCADNRHLRDVLLLKGYPVTYREFDAGHDYYWWRNSLADGLIALIGKNSN